MLLTILVCTLLLIPAPVALLIVACAIRPVAIARRLLPLQCLVLLLVTLATLPDRVLLTLLLTALLFDSLLFLVLLNALAILFPLLLLLDTLLFLVLLTLRTHLEHRRAMLDDLYLSEEDGAA